MNMGTDVSVVAYTIRIYRSIAASSVLPRVLPPARCLTAVPIERLTCAPCILCVAT